MNLIVLVAVLAATPDDARQKACEQTFKALVGDINDKNFGRSIAGRIQALNAGLRELGWQKGDTEAWATEVPALVKIFRKHRAKWLAFCKAEMKQITLPCEPYGWGTEPYSLCVQEKLPAVSCFTDGGPWRFLLSLDAGTLTESQQTLAEFMVSAASARSYCAGSQSRE